MLCAHDKPKSLPSWVKHPVLLTQRGHAAGVLVHPDQWNRLIDALEDQGDLATALAAELAVERGEEEVVEADIAELEAMAKGEQIPA